MSTDVDDPDRLQGAERPAEAATDAIPRGGVLSRRYFWISLGMCALIFLAAFESMAVTTIMPVVSRDLDGRALYALAFAGPLAVGVVGMVLAGSWSDRSGPRGPLLATVVAFALGLLIAGTATNMWMLVAGRLVQGVGAGGMLVPLYVLVARVYPPVLRPRIFAGFAAAWVVPSLVGPTAAGVVADLLSWHWVFLGVIGLVAVATLMVVPALRHPGVVGAPKGSSREGPKPPWSPVRIGCAVLVAGAVLGLNLSAEAPQPWPWVLAVVALAAAAVAVRPLLPAATLRGRPGLPAIMLVRGLLGGAFLATEVYIPYLLTGPFYGLTPAVAGLTLTGAALAWSTASWVQGRLSSVPHSRCIAVGSVLVVVGILIAIATSVFVLSPFLMFVSWLFAGAGMGLLYPRLSVAMLELSPESEQGFNSSALSIADSTGAATQIALTALVFSALLPLGGTWAITGCFALTAVLAAFGGTLARRVRRPAAA